MNLWQGISPEKALDLAKNLYSRAGRDCNMPKIYRGQLKVSVTESRLLMSFLRDSSLRTRAFLALGATFLILAVLLVLHLTSDLNERIKQAKANLLSEVTLIAMREENVVTRADSLLNGLLLWPEFRAIASLSVCQQAATNRLKVEPLFSASFLLDGQANIRCSSQPVLPVRIAPDGPFFQNMLTSKSTVVSDVMVATDGSPAIVLFGKTTRDAEGKVNDAAVLVLSLVWMKAEAANTVLPEGSRLALVDRSSLIMSRFPDPGGRTGLRMPESPVLQQIMAQPAAGTFEELGSDGDVRLFAHAPMFTTASGGGYHFILSIPRQAVVGPAQQAAIFNFGALLVVLVAALTALFWGSRRLLLDPLAQLAQTVTRMERGDLTARTGMAHGNDEIGLVAQGLDRTAAALQSREAELGLKATLIDNANDSIIVRDLENRITFWNKSAERQYGWTAEQALGKPLQSLLVADPDSVAKAEMVVRATGQWRGEIEKKRRDGSRLTVLASWTMLAEGDDAPACILTIDSDITERKLAETQLRDSEDRFRSLTEVVSEIFWIIDAERTKCLYISPAYATITGRSCQSLYDAPESWGNAIHPEDRDRVLANAAAQQSLGTYNEIYRIIRTDKSVRWLHERAFPVLGPDGTILRIVGTALDITVSRKIEEQLLQSQKMDAIGRLAGGIAHDFNNLLTVIIGYTELLLADPDLDERVLAFIRPISGAADRASSLTSQLLGFSRKSLLLPEVVNLNTTVAGIAELLVRLIGEDIEFTTVLDPGLDKVMADPSGITQVLMNLAVNARDAMPTGGKLTLETVNVYIGQDLAMPGRNPGRYAMLAMTDSGTGMPPEVRSRIFEPFYTTKPVGQGTGLGLSMVLGIIEQSGGFIGVYSELGHGTTFKIFLPSIVSTEEPVKVRERTGNLRGTETVLLVEDEQAVQDLALLSLTTHGYRVVTAVDGKDALRVMQTLSEPVDVVLTDVVMPNMSGPALVLALRARFPGIKVLFMSGYTDDVVVRHGLLDADASFIQKPFTPNELARRLRDVLDSTG